MLPENSASGRPFNAAARQSRLSLLHHHTCVHLSIFEPPLSFLPLKSTPPQPSNSTSFDGDDTEVVDSTVDRETAIEDCSRLALEAEQSLPIVWTVGEALAVLGITVSMTSSSSTPLQVVTTVSSEVASAMVEAEGLVDDLLKVIQVSSHDRIPS